MNPDRFNQAEDATPLDLSFYLLQKILKNSGIKRDQRLRARSELMLLNLRLNHLPAKVFSLKNCLNPSINTKDISYEYLNLDVIPIEI